jgi:Flp pilus assembly protein TadG
VTRSQSRSHRRERGRAADTGSTIPLVLGFFIVSLLLVAGSVAVGDAFVQHSGLQSVCDGAAVAAASSLDADAQRHAVGDARYLSLSEVQRSVETYLNRESGRETITFAAEVSQNHALVTVECTRTSTIAFGSMFGYGDGITHRVTSRARALVLGG